MKELLIRDLHTRVPYGIKAAIHGEGAYEINSISKEGFISFSTVPGMYEISDIKPYLFPMSAMTEEQKDMIYDKFGIDIDDTREVLCLDKMLECIDVLNTNHFDYRGLISKNLAIDATNLNIY